MRLSHIILGNDLLKIPEEYRKEFTAKQIAFVKNRIYLFCFLAVGVYFFTSITGSIITPSDFKVIEIYLGLVLIAGSGVVFYINHKVRTLRGAQLNAYLFTAVVLVLLVTVNIAYSDNTLASSSLFVFSFFLVSITVPWRPSGIILIWLMHIIAFTFSFLTARDMTQINLSFLRLNDYLNGFIFLMIAFALCVVVRRKESIRDVENFVLLKKVEETNSRIRQELEWAKAIHKTIIPVSRSTSMLDIAVTYLPVSYVGGDYVRYDFVNPHKVVIFISDITGHGVPAALLVNRMHAEFERLAQSGTEPGALLKELDKFIKDEFKASGMYLSAFCGLLDFKKMNLVYSNYGHPPQYMYSGKDAHLYEFSAQTSLLGLPMDDEKIYQNEIKIDDSDKLLLYTDGVVETKNSKGEDFGSARLKDFLVKNHNLTSRDFNKNLLAEDEAYKNGDFKDDICIMSIDVKGHWTERKTI